MVWVGVAGYCSVAGNRSEVFGRVKAFWAIVLVRAVSPSSGGRAGMGHALRGSGEGEAEGG